MEDERYLAIQSQEKFQFYLVALTFTILGLSIQTYDDSSTKIASLIEIISWVSLLLSGLAGLSYLEWGPVIREKLAVKSDAEETISNLKKHKLGGVSTVNVEQHGKVMPIEERINEFEYHSDAVINLIDNLEKKSKIKYKIFKWCFLAGVVFLVGGRAYAPLFTILRSS